MDESWIDPVIGARTLLPLIDPIRLRLYGDIGGFGAASTLTWQALTALDLKLAATTTLSGGYRAIGYDYDHNDFIYNIVSHGPFLGFNFEF